MSDREPGNWGLYPIAAADRVVELERPVQFPRLDQMILAVGLGRSYGDVALNNGNTIVLCRNHNAILDFDATNGILEVESGCCIAEILDLIVPEGWTLAVLPGTRFVSVGGAIANDIHGKNHHTTGTFGCHVNWLELVRSDSTYRCSATEHADLFAATIGGLGLTGIITKAELRLKRIPSSRMSVRVVKTATLAETLHVLAEHESKFEYSVAWLDLLCSERSMGRGHVMFAQHDGTWHGFDRHIPKEEPDWVTNVVRPLLSYPMVRAANSIRYHAQQAKTVERYMLFDQFFAPLDALRNWNHLYVPRGFLQYQFVVPLLTEEEVLRDVFVIIKKHSIHCYLSVLKRFGAISSPGLMSFPMEGLTLALDFPIKGDKIFRALNEMDHVILKAGGRVYPAKDARLQSSTFQHMYPQFKTLKHFQDPRISSTFWERVSRPLT